MSVAAIPPIGAGSDKWTQISSVTASGTTVSFTGISGYRKLALVINKPTFTGASTFTIRVNGDSGFNYLHQYVYFSSGASNYADLTTGIGFLAINSSNTAFGVYVFDNADSSTIKKFSGWLAHSTTVTTTTGADSTYLGSATISQISLASTQTFTGGTITLYGVQI